MSQPDAKSIAERIIEAEKTIAGIGGPINHDLLILARAYLELEYRYKMAKERIERDQHRISEIAKLKEEKDKFQKLFSQECNYREQLLFKIQELERLKK